MKIDFKKIGNFLKEHSVKNNLKNEAITYCQEILDSFTEDDRKMLKESVQDRFVVEDVEIEYIESSLQFDSIYYDDYFIIETLCEMFIIENGDYKIQIGYLLYMTNVEGDYIDESFIIYNYHVTAPVYHFNE